MEAKDTLQSATGHKGHRAALPSFCAWFWARMVATAVLNLLAGVGGPGREGIPSHWLLVCGDPCPALPCVELMGHFSQPLLCLATNNR